MWKILFIKYVEDIYKKYVKDLVKVYAKIIALG